MSDLPHGFVYKKDNASRKTLFENYYPRASVIARRYAKNAAQGSETLEHAFSAAFSALDNARNLKTAEIDGIFMRTFIEGCVAYIKSIRNEYYVSSTVYATEPSASFDLFNNREVQDFNTVDTGTLLKSIQQVAPSQRLVFNLHVIDGYTIEDAAALLETSLDTVKSNLEKARYNLQKNIASNLKTTNS